MSDTAFKNWINATTVRQYAQSLAKVTKNPKVESDINKVSRKLQELELKQRVQLIAVTLNNSLNYNYEIQLKYLLEAIEDYDIKGFELWPITEFIQKYGINHFDSSIHALYKLTQRFTSEFAIRPFINHHFESSLTLLKIWSTDPNEHVRRWTSEGIRPRLPWGEKLHVFIKDPKPILSILENLKYDSSLYVRKSVANNLNDIAKDHPLLVIKTLEKWQLSCPPNYQKEFQFIKSRALRSLIKDGHPKALNLMGISTSSKQITISHFKLKKRKVELGDYIEFEFVINNKSKKVQNYIADFAIYLLRSNGSYNKKVFKLKSGKLPSQSKLKITKRHPIKPITTRRYYSGIHYIELLTNGIPSDKTKFILSAK